MSGLSIRRSKFRVILALIVALMAIKYGPFFYFSFRAPYCVGPNMSPERAREIYSLAQSNRNLAKAAFLVTPSMVANYFSDQYVMLAKHLDTPEELILGVHAVFVSHGAVSDGAPNSTSGFYFASDEGLKLLYTINPWLFMSLSPAVETAIDVTFPTPKNRRFILPSGQTSIITTSGLIIFYEPFNFLYPSLDFLKFGSSSYYPPFSAIASRLKMCPNFARMGSFEYGILQQWKASRQNRN